MPRVSAIAADVELYAPRIEHVSASRVWLHDGRRESPWSCALDTRTAAPLGNDGRGRDDRLFARGDVAVRIRHGAVTRLGEAREELWSFRPGVELRRLRIAGANGAHVAVTAEGKGGPRLLVLRAGSGELAFTIPLPSPVAVLPPHFVSVGPCAYILTDGGECLRVDPSRGTAERIVALPSGSLAALGGPPLFTSEGRLWVTRTRAGAMGRATAVTAFDIGAGAVAGEIPLPSPCAIVPFGTWIAAIAHARHAQEATLVSLAGARSLPLGRADVVASEGRLLALAAPGRLTVIEMGAESEPLSVPLPPGAVHDVAIAPAGERVVVTLDRRVLFIELPPEKRGAHDLALRAPAPPLGSDEPGVVASGLTSIVPVDHPKFGRVTIRAPAKSLSRGQRVYFDRVHVAPTGIVTVEAWHLEGQSPPALAPPAPEVLTWAPHADAAPAVEPAPAEDEHGADTQGGAAMDVAAIASLPAAARTPLFTRVIETMSADAVFGLLQGELTTTGGPADFLDDPDPRFLPFVDHQDGDYTGFYAVDAAPFPVVRWRHDEQDELEWLGASFDEFVAAELWQRLDADRESVARNLAILDLPLNFPRAPASRPPAKLAGRFRWPSP